MRKLRLREGNDISEATLLVGGKAELQSPRTDQGWEAVTPRLNKWMSLLKGSNS